MRLQRTGSFHGSGRIDVDRDLAAEIEAGKLIVFGFRDAQSVTDEDHGRFQSGRQIGAGVDGGVGALQRRGRAVANDGEAGLVVDELAGFELDVLEVAVGTGRLKAVGFHFAGDVFDGFAIAVGADVATLELVVGQELDVGPPAVAFGYIVGGKQCGGCKQEKD